MIEIRSNEDRADVGEVVFDAFIAVQTYSKPNADTIEATRFDWVGDMLADIAHYCARWGIDPREIFERGLTSYDQDNDRHEIGGYKPVKRRQKRQKA